MAAHFEASTELGAQGSDGILWNTLSIILRHGGTCIVYFEQLSGGNLRSKNRQASYQVLLQGFLLSDSIFMVHRFVTDRLELSVLNQDLLLRCLLVPVSTFC